MDRFAIFVDAGYLYAEGGKLAHNTGDRLRLELNFRETIAALTGLGREHSGIHYLRTYWYDAATDATPTPSHMAVASIPGVKLRLGRLSSGRQKGVDSRIVRDLIVLARDRAITSAYVLSGDEDIREGVAEAQDCGVSVVLLGITPRPGQNNQARSLVQEADGLVMLTRDVVGQWFTLRPARPFPGTSAPPAPIGSTDFQEIGRQFGEAWAQLNPDEVSKTIRSRPRIPQEVDRELLARGSAETGADLTDSQRRSLRAGFWAAPQLIEVA
jgi:uncharacterized LabA/DUF88 family protein